VSVLFDLPGIAPRFEDFSTVRPSDKIAETPRLTGQGEAVPGSNEIELNPTAVLETFLSKTMPNGQNRETGSLLY